jgi:hypothetical protein
VSIDLGIPGLVFVRNELVVLDDNDFALDFSERFTPA